jgi:flagellar hook-associated protein 2
MTTPVGGTIQVGGLASGIDTESMISKLMDIEQAPITQINNKEQAFNVELTAYSALETKLNAFKSAMDSLSSTVDFKSFSASSSDESIFTATAGMSAVPGSHDITVQQLAKVQKLYSTGFSQSEAVGEGTLHIEGGSSVTIDSSNNKINFKEDAGSGLGSELTATIASGTYTVTELEAAVKSAMETASAAGGNSATYDVSYDAASQKFSISDGGGTLTELDLLWGSGTDAAASVAATMGFSSADETGATTYTADTTTGNVVDVTVGATDTISDVADAINASDADVTATVIYDGSQYVLSLAGKQTGDANAFNLTATDSDGNNTDTNGLSRLVYDAGGTTNMTQVQAAQDAILNVDGVTDITRSSNTISDVITGITLNLTGAHADPLTDKDTLTVTQNSDSISTNIQTFVTAYNDLLDFFSQYQAKYDPQAQTAGTLLGDPTTNSIRSSLRNQMAQIIPGNGAISQLADLGITLSQATTPKLQLDSTTLASALNDHFDEVQAFFTGFTDSGGSDVQGFATSMENALNGFLDSYDGTLTARQSGITTSIDRLETQKSTLQTRLDNEERRLRAQFNNMELLLSQYQTTGDYLTQQITALQNLAKSK